MLGLRKERHFYCSIACGFIGGSIGGLCPVMWSRGRKEGVVRDTPPRMYVEGVVPPEGEEF